MTGVEINLSYIIDWYCLESFCSFVEIVDEWVIFDRRQGQGSGIWKHCIREDDLVAYWNRCKSGCRREYVEAVENGTLRSYLG